MDIIQTKTCPVNATGRCGANLCEWWIRVYNTTKKEYVEGCAIVMLVKGVLEREGDK